MLLRRGHRRAGQAGFLVPETGIMPLKRWLWVLRKQSYLVFPERENELYCIYLAAPLNFSDSIEPRSKSSVDEDEGCCCCCCWDAAFVSDAVATEEEEAEDDEAVGCCCCCCCEPGGDVLLPLPPPPFAGTIPSSLANSEGR